MRVRSESDVELQLAAQLPTTLCYLQQASPSSFMPLRAIVAAPHHTYDLTLEDPMRFKVKDVIVAIPGDGDDDGPDFHVEDTCGASSCTLCTGRTQRSPFRVGDIFDLDEYRQSLGRLKLDLRSRLAAIEEQERVLDAGMKPTNPTDLEAVEQRLNAALTEIREMKARTSGQGS